MSYFKKLVSRTQLLILLSFGLCVGALALTPPGTIILNSALLSYQDSVTNETVTGTSNATSVAVGHSHSFFVENTHQLSVDAGVVAQFPHRISNQGNSDDSYRFTFQALDTDAFDTPSVYLDTNGNGEIDSSEQAIDQTALLQPGESIDVVIAARVSHLLDNGEQRSFEFTVESDQSDKTQTIINEVTVGSPGKLRLTLRSFPGCEANLLEGDIITHSIDAQNFGSRPIVGVNYLLDGVVSNGLIVEIPVTQDTGFFGFQQSQNSTLQGIAVVRLDGFADNEWLRAEPDNNDISVANDFAPDAVVSAGYWFDPSQLLEGEIASFTTEFQVQNQILGQNKVFSTAFTDTDNDGIADISSNTTCQTLSGQAAATLGVLQFVGPSDTVKNNGLVPDFNADADFVNAQQYILKRSENDPYAPFRDGLYLQLLLEGTERSDIKSDAAGNRYIVATVASELTDDSVQVVLLETAQAGVFRSLAPIELTTQSKSNGGFCPVPPDTGTLTPVFEQTNPACVLGGLDNDRLSASIGESGSGLVVASVAFVNQQSVVFDSQSLEPLAGATVQIKRADTGEVETDSVTGVLLEFRTDSNGAYTLPRLPDDVDYFIEVIPPVGYVFPSAVVPERFIDFNVHGVSYGREGFDRDGPLSGTFRGASLNAQESIDIPLDRGSVENVLSIDKTAVQTTFDLGEAVPYTVTVRNTSTENLNQVLVLDTMPFGFRYVAGTTVLNGETTVDPVRNAEGELEFSIGDLASEQSVVVSYVLRASAAAVDGSGVNTAVASGFTASGLQVESLPGKARVELARGGVFSDRAALFGKVYVDQNCDGIQNNKEWPIGGVTLYLQDGTYIITDGDGLYSLYGLRPGNHVITLDTHTLPAGLDLKIVDVDQAADPDSRFLVLSQGDYHRADFAAGCPKEGADRIFEELKSRNQSLDPGWVFNRADSINNSVGSRSVSNPLSRVTGADGDISNGVLDGPRNTNNGLVDVGAVIDDVGAEGDDSSFGFKEAETDSENTNKSRKLDAEQIVSEITQAQARSGTWLWPQGDLSINGRFMAVVRAGIDPTLYVNDQPVPASHIGERMVNRREKAQVVAWYGIELDSGENKVEVKGKGPFGNQRVLASGVFKRPSTGTQIRLTPQSSSVPADGGRSTLPVKIEILDENGYPALGVYFITLDNTDGTWAEPDIQDSEPGRQIRIENGQRTVHYKSSGITGEVRIRASTAEYFDESVIHQSRESRPLFVSGFVEAGGYFSTESIGDFSATTDLGSLSTTGRFDSRAALFIKGTIKKDYHLTLSYDSDKDSDEELLRDINPDLHYPLHGDASIRGFEAQSRSKLYVRVERNKNSILWGDFLTNPGSDKRDIARIQRTLTGLSGVFETGKNTFKVFAAEEENRNLVEEIPGNGSALGYRLRQFPIVPNSETVELVTRSRLNVGLVLESVRLSRLGDYTVDDDTGFLTFSSVVPTLDADLNPVFIRISYDIENGGEDFIVSGASFDRKVNDRLSIGASISNDDNPQNGTTLVGIYGDYELGKKTRLSVSVAVSDSREFGNGEAHTVYLDHIWSEGDGSRTSFRHARADSDFSNVNSAVSVGRTETSLSHLQRLGSNTKLLLDANDTRSSITQDQRRSLSALVETHIKDWQFRAGLRQISERTGNGDEDFLTAVLGLRRKFSIFSKSAQTDIEYEQDTGLASRRRLAVGAKLNLHDHVRAYSNYELSNSLVGFGGLFGDLETESFTLGVESDILRSTRMFTEYRMRGAFEAVDYESANGVRGDYEIVEGLRISPNFEYIKRLGNIDDGDANDGDSVSASVAVTDARNPNSRRLIRLETRYASNSRHLGLRGSWVARLNNDWTGMVADNFSRQEITGADSVLRHTFFLAASRRPKYQNKHHMLFLYQLKEEDGVINGVDRTTQLLSTHHNVEINKAAIFTGRMGVKYDSSAFGVTDVSNFSTLTDVRLSFDLGRRFNIDTIAGALTTDRLSEIRYSLGMGLNYTLNKNLRLNLAYNLIGFRDEDLDSEEYNARGGRISLQYKLDEDLFNWLN